MRTDERAGRSLPPGVAGMKRSYIGLAMGALVAIGAALSLPSCGHDQKLVSITITPSTFTFLTQAGSEQYTATGTYIHPPATKDITSQATWKVDDGVVAMNAGLASPSPDLGCGGGTISASLPAGKGGGLDICIGDGARTLDNPARLICPVWGALATMTLGGTR